MTLPSTMARGGLVLALATVIASPAAAQFNSNYQLAIPLQPAGLAAPTLDGRINPPADNPNEWSGSLLYRMEDGAPMPAASMRAMHDANTIWLGFTTEDNTCDQDIEAGCMLETYPLFGANDLIVVAFNINGSPTGYRRLHIQPCFDAANPALNQCSVNGPASGQVAQLTYWTGVESGGTVNWTPAAVPAGIEARTATQILPSGLTPSRGTWAVELQLPRTIVSVPASGFGLFVDVIPINSAYSTATQYAWPSDLQIAGSDGSDIAAQITSTPPPKRWGIARLGALAAGVSVVGFGSNSNGPTSDPTKISLTTANEFHATLANGSAAPATGLVSTFRIANWGIPGGTWIPIPTTAWTPEGSGLTRSNPTPPVMLNQNDYVTVYSGRWTLTPAEQARYRDNPHQCVRVDVAGNLGVSTSRQFNMDFVEVNSPFEGMPTISLPQRNPLINPNKFTTITLREQFINVDPRMVWKTRIPGAEALGNGRWGLRASPGSMKRLQTSVLVDDSLRLPSETYKFGPNNATGMEIGVMPDSTMTVLANGGFRTREGTVTPDGLNDGKRRLTGPVTATSPLPVNRGDKYPDKPAGPCGPREVEIPSTAVNCIRPGALVGSFDNFRSSFLIGPAATLKVPKQARQLMIRLAPDNGKPLRVEGDGFTVQVIGQATDQLVHLPEVDPRLFAKSGLALLPLGANLPAWVMRAEVDTGRFVTINGTTYSSYLPLGSFGSFITEVRQASPR